MPDRVMKVNAYTTLDLLDGRTEGHDFEEEAFATRDSRPHGRTRTASRCS